MSGVPLIIAAPHVDLSRNLRVKMLTEVVDILPSPMDYLGIQPGKRFDVTSFISLLSWRPPLFRSKRRAGSNPVEHDLRKQLRSLGYI